MSGYDDEKWLELYKGPYWKLERALITGRIADARDEVKSRVEKLRRLPGLHSEEYAAIEDALLNRRALEEEESQLAEDDKKRALEQTFQNLQSIAPKIQALEERN